MIDSRGKVPFWLVWNPEGRSPMIQHLELSLAKAEAERLARAHPGQQFYILAPLSETKVAELQVRYFAVHSISE